MWEYLKRHEAFVRRLLEEDASGTDWEGLREFHRLQVDRMQAERLVHLHVTLAFGLYLLIALAFVSMRPSWATGALTVLVALLVGPYVVHYFRLENGVQRWYHLANRIDRKCGRLSASCE